MARPGPAATDDKSSDQVSIVLEKFAVPSSQVAPKGGGLSMDSDQVIRRYISDTPTQAVSPPPRQFQEDDNVLNNPWGLPSDVAAYEASLRHAIEAGFAAELDTYFEIYLKILLQMKPRFALNFQVALKNSVDPFFCQISLSMLIFSLACY